MSDGAKADQVLAFCRGIGMELTPWQEKFLRAWVTEVDQPPVEGNGLRATMERARRRSAMTPPWARPHYGLLSMNEVRALEGMPPA